MKTEGILSLLMITLLVSIVAKADMHAEYASMIKGRAIVVLSDAKSGRILQVATFTATNLVGNIIYTNGPSVRFQCFGDLVNPVIQQIGVSGIKVQLTCQGGKIMGINGNTLSQQPDFTTTFLEEVKQKLADKAFEATPMAQERHPAISGTKPATIGQSSGASEERAKVGEKQVKVKPDYSKLQLKADDHARDSFSLTIQAVARMYGIDVDYETVYGLSCNGFAPGIHSPEDCRQLQRMHDRGQCLDIVAARLGLVLRPLDLDFRRNTKPWVAIREALQRGEVVVASSGWLDAPYAWWGIILEAPENGPVNAIRGATQNGRRDTRLDHVGKCWAVTLGKPTLTPEQADIAMLQRAVARIRGDKEPFLLGDDQVAYGLKAMDLWIADMRKPAFQASDPASSMGNAANCALYSCEGARDTRSYLRRRLVTFPEAARSHIDAAADQYEFIWRQLAPFAVLPGGYTTVIGDPAKQKDHADKVLLPCKEAMSKAADEMEKALATTE